MLNFARNRQRRRLRIMAEYRTRLEQWRDILEYVESYVGPQAPIKRWRFWYGHWCRPVHPTVKFIGSYRTQASIIEFISAATFAGLVLRMQLLMLPNLIFLGQPRGELVVLIVLLTVIFCASAHRIESRYRLLGAVAFMGSALALAILAVWAISGADLDRGTIDSFVGSLVSYTTAIVYLIGRSVGRVVSMRIGRFGRMNGLRRELLKMLCMLDSNGLVLVSARGRADLLDSLYHAADCVEFGLALDSITHSRMPDEAKNHFRDSSAYLRQMANWVAVPQVTTLEDLRTTLAAMFAAVFTGRLHYLPRAETAKFENPYTVRVVLVSLRNLAASAAPAGILLTADRFGMLPDGLRGWILTVSILGFVVGLVVALSPRGLQHMRTAVELLPLQGKS